MTAANQHVLCSMVEPPVATHARQDAQEEFRGAARNSIRDYWQGQLGALDDNFRKNWVPQLEAS